jgi:hypothetical protein
VSEEEPAEEAVAQAAAQTSEQGVAPQTDAPETPENG